MSSLLWWTGAVLAHEVRPAIADVDVGRAEVRLEIYMALEALIAGVNLDGLQDTNDSPMSGFYDQLRAQDPEALERALRKAWPGIAQGLSLYAGENRLLPEIVDVTIPPVGDTELPRDSRLTLRATLPEDGTPVTIGWSAAYGPLVLRQDGAGGDAYTGYLTSGAVSDPLPREGVAQQGALVAFGRYVVVGFQHIVPKGLDHILFVLGLFFFSMRMRPLLMQVTAFTVAHTLTLALATLKIIALPAAIVEPLIAASIVYVGVENILQPKLGWQRTAVVFAFGLLHGLGFASVLGEIGLAPSRFVTGLIGFNIGVELGQLAVIASAFLAIGLWLGRKSWYRPYFANPASGAIALVGAWWFVERVMAVL